ncbi:MAG: metalloregulator ArsR/SmtB family transcription factor [Methanomassiliicoccus sp.]|nr:metalloregulator ArsR/SmtB family transcription factor [Methanomassiliicoccus sp.]
MGKVEVITKKVSKSECCDDVRNLPEEMESAIAAIGGMDRLRTKVPDRDGLVVDAAMFQALSDPIRLQILHTLAVTDLCPCILKEITGLSDSKLSYHLNILEGSGLISSSHKQRWRIYGITELGRSRLMSHGRPEAVGKASSPC